MNTIELFKHRYSCRCFTKEQLTDTELDTLLQAGNAAPIGMNRIQDYQLFVIQDSTLLQALETTTHTFYQNIRLNLSALYNAPTLLLVAARKLVPSPNAPAYFTNALEHGQYCSAACMIENMIMAATELGLGSVFLTGVTTALKQDATLKKELAFLTSLDQYALWLLENLHFLLKHEISLYSKYQSTMYDKFVFSIHPPTKTACVLLWGGPFTSSY